MQDSIRVKLKFKFLSCQTIGCGSSVTCLERYYNIKEIFPWA